MMNHVERGINTTRWIDGKPVTEFQAENLSYTGPDNVDNLLSIMANQKVGTVLVSSNNPFPNGVGATGYIDNISVEDFDKASEGKTFIVWDDQHGRLVVSFKIKNKSDSLRYALDSYIEVGSIFQRYAHENTVLVGGGEYLSINTPDGVVFKSELERFHHFITKGFQDKHDSAELVR
jgi:hypothetical protein